MLWHRETLNFNKLSQNNEFFDWKRMIYLYLYCLELWYSSYFRKVLVTREQLITVSTTASDCMFHCSWFYGLSRSLSCTLRQNWRQQRPKSLSLALEINSSSLCLQVNIAHTSKNNFFRSSRSAIWNAKRAKSSPLPTKFSFNKMEYRKEKSKKIYLGPKVVVTLVAIEKHEDNLFCLTPILSLWRHLH